MKLFFLAIGFLVSFGLSAQDMHHSIMLLEEPESTYKLTSDEIRTLHPYTESANNGDKVWGFGLFGLALAMPAAGLLTYAAGGNPAFMHFGLVMGGVSLAGSVASFVSHGNRNRGF